jgi:hypothetical protein
MPVALLRTVTSTPGIRAPFSSVTWPIIEEVDWACRGKQTNRRTNIVLRNVSIREYARINLSALAAC